MRPAFALGLAVSLAFAPACLSAQRERHLTTDGAILVIECDGPALLARKFAQTKLSAMLHSEAFAQLVTPYQAMVVAALEDMQVPGAPLDVLDGLRKAATTYAGRMTMAWWVSNNGDAEPTIWTSTVLEHDGSLDLPAACKAMERWARDAELPLRPIKLGGEEWLLIDPEDGQLSDWSDITLPRMLGNRLVSLMTSGDDGAAFEPLFRDGPPPARKATAEQPLPPVRIRADLPQLVKLLTDVLGEELGEGLDVAKLLGTLGLDRLGTLTYEIHTHKQYVDVRADLAIGKDARGLWSVFGASRTTKPTALDLIPRGADEFSAEPLDFAALLALAKAILPQVPAGLTWEEFDALAASTLGIGVSDLFAPLGTELFTMRKVEPLELDPDADLSLTSWAMLGSVNGQGAGIPLRDGAAMRRALERLLEHTGLARLRKTDNYEGHDFHRVTIPGANLKLYWVVTETLLLAGVGDSGLQLVKDTLLAVAARARGEAPAAFPPPTRERIEALAPGYAQLAVAGTTGFLDTFASVGQFAFGASEEAQGLLQAIAKLKDLMRAHDLLQTVSATYNEPGRRRARTLW